MALSFNPFLMLSVVYSPQSGHPNIKLLGRELSHKVCGSLKITRNALSGLLLKVGQLHLQIKKLGACIGERIAY